MRSSKASMKLRCGHGAAVVVTLAAAVVGCQRVELIADGAPAYGHTIKRGDDVVALDHPPVQPYRVVGHLAFQQLVGEDDTTFRALREEAGKLGCDAVVMPPDRGTWAECVVMEPVALAR
jgi:hypothetical protein